MGIPCNPNPNPNREGNIRKGCPYHCNIATKRQGNWLELTFAKISATVTGDSPFAHLPYAQYTFLPPKTLHNLCFSFLPEITVVPRVIKDNACTKFWGHTRSIMGNVKMANGGKKWPIAIRSVTSNDPKGPCES